MSLIKSPHIVVCGVYGDYIVYQYFNIQRDVLVRYYYRRFVLTLNKAPVLVRVISCRLRATNLP